MGTQDRGQSQRKNKKQQSATQPRKIKMRSNTKLIFANNTAHPYLVYWVLVKVLRAQAHRCVLCVSRWRIGILFLWLIDYSLTSSKQDYCYIQNQYKVDSIRKIHGKEVGMGQLGYRLLTSFGMYENIEDTKKG